LVVAEFRGATFPAKVTRTAGAIDPASRTLLTELEVDNSDGKLLAGSYSQVLLPGATMDAPLTVPANALIFRSDGAQLAVVGGDGVVTFAKITLGRDFGASVEISEGVTGQSRVVLNPPDSLTDGMHVEVVQ
jgi:membrane fusion protein, multidrug efflux system